jgi:hypothetical protein
VDYSQRSQEAQDDDLEDVLKMPILPHEMTEDEEFDAATKASLAVPIPQLPLVSALPEGSFASPDAADAQPLLRASHYKTEDEVLEDAIYESLVDHAASTITIPEPLNFTHALTTPISAITASTVPTYASKVSPATVTSATPVLSHPTLGHLADEKKLPNISSTHRNVCVSGRGDEGDSEEDAEENAQMLRELNLFQAQQRATKEANAQARRDLRRRSEQACPLTGPSPEALLPSSSLHST